MERLAENAHEVWARKRLSEGWTYGSEKNAERKQTPWLVPYCELPDAEKDTDRQVIRESLKAAYALGWRIKMLLEVDLEQERHNPQRLATFDMNDQPELDAGVLEPFPVLRDAIAFLQHSLYPVWCNADTDALRQQKRHRWVALCAIFAGVAAIVLAVVQLALESQWPALRGMVAGMEMASVAIAALAVVLGVWARFQRRWLGQRQAAERLRSVKFCSLAWPELWDAHPEPWRQRVRDAVDELVKLDIRQAEEWAMEDHPEPDTVVPLTNKPEPATVRALAMYYCQKRLGYQQDFFARRSQAYRTQARRMRPSVQLALFGTSVCLVLLHVAAEFIHHLGHGEGWKIFAVVALTFAAILPVVGFGMRARLSAFEIPRSAIFYNAKERALRLIVTHVQADADDIDKTRTHIVRSEHFLEDEHRDWCRLLLEAEWFL